MKSAEDDLTRVRLYGPNDLAAGWHVNRVVELATEFSPAQTPTSIVDVLELHNVQQYLEHDILPSSLSPEVRAGLIDRAPQIRSTVARFFTGIDDSNFASIVTSIGYEYHEDLVHLLGRNKAFQRCTSSIVLPSLEAAGVFLGEMLECEPLVRAYGTEMRSRLLAEPRNAELLARKYLAKDSRGSMHLPQGFTSLDARNLFERYIDSDDANLNYVRLISAARDHAGAGIDAKLKLRAKRRSDELNTEMFKQNSGFKTGCEVSISEDQDEPVVYEIDSSDGSVWRYKYSRRWLEQTTDNASILNNFQHLFEFVDEQVLLTLPAYPAHFGVMERVMGVTGNSEYKISAHFRNVDARSLLQTHMYLGFLRSRDLDLERVISWFFDAYLVEAFGIVNFSFVPSDAHAPYLHRVRHLFAEMESVATQFSLFVENGELDRELLTMGADAVRFSEIPSLLTGKYLYPTDSEEIAGVLHLLFSDQSRLNYIHEGLRDRSAAALILNNTVTLSDFHHYQRESIDHLVKMCVLETTTGRVRFANTEQLLILARMFNTQAANYYHLSTVGRQEADRMVAKGWLTRRASLMTGAESDYFNYFLNRVGFSNGPNLRNRYLHGAQAPADTDDAHFNTYLVAVRLIMALVIKMNDDLCLSAIDTSPHPPL